MQIKYGNWAILLFFSLVIGTTLWWFTPQRIVNECDELRAKVTKLEKKVYQFENPEEHTVHFGKLGIRSEGVANYYSDDRDIAGMFTEDEYYRYPLEMKCGYNFDCKCGKPLYLTVPRGMTHDLSEKTVEVRQVKDRSNYFELLRIRSDSTIVVDQ
jgi:hypothetical protein